MQRRYERQLKGIAKHIGELVAGFDVDKFESLPPLVKLLKAYADALKPWAAGVGARMIGEVDKRDRQSWAALGSAISAGLRQEIDRTPVGGRAKALLAEQVELITSVPRDAAERIHELAQQALVDGTRAKEIAAEIARSGEVSKSHAILIARTEVSRASTALLQARCEAIDATHYIWRTAEDADVRPGHKAMDGKVCAWASPPAVDENGKIMHHHPGEIWNCRCWAEPIIPELTA